MTYRYYIRKNGLPDSKETYREYCEKYHSAWKAMNEAMRNQFIDFNFMYRFAIQWR